MKIAVISFFFLIWSYGVTLLALGNGAPDISSILIGLLGGLSSIGVGEPVGMVFCVICVCCLPLLSLTFLMFDEK